MSIEIREHTPGADLDDFIRVHHEIFRGDPVWFPPLEFELRERLSPKKNPFFKHAEVALFTAWKDGKLAGRISAQVCEEHLRIHKDEAGFFGFFDTIDDQEVATALLSKAEEWLKARGSKVMRGPFSLSINEESGTLIDGFDTPPALMMGHSRPYQGNLAEGYGLEKAQDMFAWKYIVQKPTKRAHKAWEDIHALPEVNFRSVDTSSMRRELDTLLAVFNDAWKDNWGFVPSTEEEVAAMAELMKYLIDPRIAFFVEVKGEVAAICVALPNINEMISDLEGKLLPFGWAKLIWRLKVKKPKSARLMLLGISSKFRGKKRYGGLSMAMFTEIAYRGTEAGYEWAELGWTLEDNRAINLGIKAMKAKVYKTYRMYEKSIE